MMMRMMKRAAVVEWLGESSSNKRVGSLIPPLFSHMSTCPWAKHCAPAAFDVCLISMGMEFKHWLVSIE